MRNFMSNWTTKQIDNIREQFPFLQKKIPGNKPLVFFDSAASSQKPNTVIEAISNFYAHHYANIHRGLYSLSIEATEKYEQARQKIASFWGVANDPSQIIFTKGATEALNLLAHSLGNDLIYPNDEIVITDLEHHANLVPWQQMAIQKKAKLIYLPISQLSSVADINETWLAQYFSSKTKILAFTGMSNALGTLLPWELMGRFAQKNGSIVVLDAAQLAAHTTLHFDKLPIDFAVAAGHKMLGPTGIGILYGKRKRLEQLSVYQMGGDMIQTVEKYSTTWNTIPQKFEAGTPPIAQAIGLKKALSFLENIGMDQIHAYENTLTQYALQQMKEIPGMHIYGESNIKHRGGVISFNIQGIHPFDIGTLLAEENIAMRVGHHCCQVLMKELNTPATCRISFYLYNTKEEIDLFIQSLRKTLKMLNG